MRHTIFKTILLSLLLGLAACAPHENSAVTSNHEPSLTQSEFERTSATTRGTVTFSITKTKNTVCRDPNAKIDLAAVGAGADMKVCLAYTLLTGVTYKCDLTEKYENADEAGWSYLSASDKWSTSFSLKDNVVPGNYTVYAKSSNGAVSLLSYAISNTGGDLKSCSGDVREPWVSSIRWPQTVVTEGPMLGTYSSQSTLKRKADRLGYGNQCINIDGVRVYGPNNPPPCIELVSSTAPPPPSTCTDPKPADEERTLSCPAGQTGSITEKRTFICSNTVWTAGMWTQVSNTCVGTPPPQPPPQPPGACPVNKNSGPMGLTSSVGTPQIWALKSGRVGYTTIPASNYVARDFALSATTITSGAVQISISKCKGVIDSSVKECFRSTGSQLAKVYFNSAPTAKIPDAETAKARGVCWTPESEGPWYVNVVFLYDSCPYATCGWAAQWQKSGF